MEMIETKGLTKTFKTRKGNVEAVRGVDLQVHEGEIFGFLGPNGADKTTTMRMLATLLDPTSGMMHRPRLLIMDEPTTGLDPQSRARIWDEVRRLRSEGVTIFLTTHYMDEADGLCDRVAIIDGGKIVSENTPMQPSLVSFPLLVRKQIKSTDSVIITH